MKHYIYTDGVANVSLAGGMVRLDMYHYEGAPQAGRQELPRVVDQQLVMPPAAFMRAFESMQRFVEELEKQGVVQRGAAQSPQASPQPQASSPNFE